MFKICQLGRTVIKNRPRSLPPAYQKYKKISEILLKINQSCSFNKRVSITFSTLSLLGLSSVVSSPIGDSDCDQICERSIDAFISYRRSTGSQLARSAYTPATSLLWLARIYTVASAAVDTFFLSLIIVCPNLDVLSYAGL